MNAQKLAITIFAAASMLAPFASGCASTGKSAVPDGAHVQLFRGERTVLRGTADRAAASPSCDPVAAAQAKHLVELGDDTLMTIALRPEAEGSRMPGAILHMTHLGSQRTWCIATDAEGLTAELGGELPGGVYALEVTEPSNLAAYEIVLRRL